MAQDPKTNTAANDEPPILGNFTAEEQDSFRQKLWAFINQCAAELDGDVAKPIHHLTSNGDPKSGSEGGFAALENFLKNPTADVNLPTENGTTALQIATSQALLAAELGKPTTVITPVVKQLIEHGAHVNTPAPGEEKSLLLADLELRPLFVAAQFGDIEGVRYLLDPRRKGEKVDVNAKDKNGMTVLQNMVNTYTSMSPSTGIVVTDTVKELIMHGADINTQVNGRSLLSLAASSDPEGVAWLLNPKNHPGQVLNLNAKAGTPVGLENLSSLSAQAFTASARTSERAADTGHS